MKVTVRFFRHGGICRPICSCFKGGTEVPLSDRGRPRLFRTHRKVYAHLIVATSSERLFLERGNPRHIYKRNWVCRHLHQMANK
jgi:hypothetical protein